MVILPVRIKHALDVSVQRPHDADACEHCWPAERRMTCVSTMLERTVALANARLRQLRLPCVPKRQVGNAFCHFAHITVRPPAFFPNPVDLVVVAAHIKGRVDNPEEKNREYRDADHPHARLLPRYAADAFEPSEAQARTIGPAPWIFAMRGAGPERDRAHAHVTVIDVPAFVGSIESAAAG
jgi:hypothetical protein